MLNMNDKIVDHKRMRKEHAWRSSGYLEQRLHMKREEEDQRGMARNLIGSGKFDKSSASQGGYLLSNWSPPGARTGGRNDGSVESLWDNMAASTSSSWHLRV